MLLPESDRVMEEPAEAEYIEGIQAPRGEVNSHDQIQNIHYFKEFVPNFIMPVAERVREEPVVIVIPDAQRVVDTQVTIITHDSYFHISLVAECLRAAGR